MHTCICIRIDGKNFVSGGEHALSWCQSNFDDSLANIPAAANPDLMRAAYQTGLANDLIYFCSETAIHIKSKPNFILSL